MTQFHVTPVTAEQVISSDRNEYNYAEWKKNVVRYGLYENCLFYKRDDKEEYYAVYTTEEGIRFIQEISYSSMLSNSGFQMVRITPEGLLYTVEFYINGKFCHAENCKKNRKEFAKLTKELGTIFTNSL